jgi:hypothetical protein
MQFLVSRVVGQPYHGAVVHPSATFLTLTRKCVHVYEGCNGTSSANPSVAFTVQDMLHFMCWKVLDHSSYSLDLCDFIMYALLVKVLKGSIFG